MYCEPMLLQEYKLLNRYMYIAQSSIHTRNSSLHIIIFSLIIHVHDCASIIASCSYARIFSHDASLPTLSFRFLHFKIVLDGLNLESWVNIYRCPVIKCLIMEVNMALNWSEGHWRGDAATAATENTIHILVF